MSDWSADLDVLQLVGICIILVLLVFKELRDALRTEER